MATPTKISDYKGYEIMKLSSYYSGTKYYLIYKLGVQKSCFTLASEQACKNVIDTYLRKYKTAANVLV